MSKARDAPTKHNKAGSHTGPNIIYLKKKTLIQHRLYLIRHIERIANQKEYLQGPIDAWPQGRMTLPIPPDVFSGCGCRSDSVTATTSNTTSTSSTTGGGDKDSSKKTKRNYTFSKPGPRLVRRDLRGSSKINRDGLLKNGAQYLFTIFRIPMSGTSYFVLLRDLMRVVLWDGDEQSFLDKFGVQLCPLVCSSLMVRYLVKSKILERGGSESGSGSGNGKDQIEGKEEENRNRGNKDKNKDGMEAEIKVDNDNDDDGKSKTDVETHEHNAQQDSKVYIVSARAAFILFGAAVIACGKRVTDDYWEEVATGEKLTPRHRVTRIPDDLVKVILTLNPSLDKETNIIEKADDPTSISKVASPTGSASQRKLGHDNNDNTNSNNNNKEGENQEKLETTNKPKSSLLGNPPYAIVAEQPSMEVKMQYLKEFSKCEQISSLVPGQGIVGGMELTSQFRVPKYHSKNSFWQASQLKAMDVPIGQHESLMDGNMKPFISTDDMPSNPNNSVVVSTPAPAPTIANADNTSDATNTVNALSTTTYRAEHEDNTGHERISLNINGWKFENLPSKIGSPSGNKTQTSKLGSLYPCVTDHFSQSGLPVYDFDTVYTRVLKLSPNQIKALEFSHDSVLFNAGMQRIRGNRRQDWLKYWQYKAGVPIGLKPNQLGEFKGVYLKEILERITVEEKYNENTNCDEKHTTKRIPNGNFMGYANIKLEHPQYQPDRASVDGDMYAKAAIVAIERNRNKAKAKVTKPNLAKHGKATDKPANSEPSQHKPAKAASSRVKTARFKLVTTFSSPTASAEK